MHDSATHSNTYNCAGPMQDYDAGVNYFVGKFMEKNKNPNKKIYHHVTCATDTSNVQVVFNSCKGLISVHFCVADCWFCLCRYYSHGESE